MAQCSPFESRPALCAAVSGGADSMALLLLAQDWAKARGGNVVALTVDHGLRAGSGVEAAQVQQWCRQRGIEHLTLHWQPPAKVSGIPARAREARYRLLAQFCRERNILHLLTAHHRGDQAETLLFRVARGSGLEGLACMAAVSQQGGIRLLRPLLAASKERLVATLQARAQEWVEDPTNHNLDYTRNALRHAMRQTREYEALAAQACTLAQHFGKVRNALLNQLVGQLTEGVFLAPEAYAVIDAAHLRSLPPELALGLISAVAQTLSGAGQAPRREKTLRFYRSWKEVPLTRRSFSGLLWTPRKGDKLLVAREPRALAGALALPPGATMLWDGRFHVQFLQKKPLFEELTVRALGAHGLKYLRETCPAVLKKYEKPALAALPSFWNLETLIAVPHIHYQSPTFAELTFHAPFYPAKPLAGRLFSGMNIL